MNALLEKGALVGPLRIEALANGGAGITREDGRVIFVPATVPGDLIRCRITKVKKRYAEAELFELLEASAERRIPPCPVAAECGGCQWQQLPYQQQLEWKERLFRETLVRQGLATPEQVLPIVASPAEWHYRSRVQVKCFLAPSGFVTGFYRPKSRYVVAVERCPLMAEELNDLLVLLRESLSESPYAAEIPQIDLALGDDGHRRAVVHYLGHNQQGLSRHLAPVVTEYGGDLLIQSGRKDSLFPVTGSGELTVKVDQPELSLKYGAGGFAQINLAQNRRLVKDLNAAAQLTGHEHVLDLFCGMGNFSLPLARRSARLVGVEDYAPSIAMARRNATENHLENAHFHACSAEGALLRFTVPGQPFDLVVLDPPRSGAYGVMKDLVRSPVKRVIYVSCDPQTLARDLKPLLHSGYRLIASCAYDMFPQTYHVESMTLLEHLTLS